MIVVNKWIVVVCLCTLGKCCNVMVVDWGPHDVPMALYGMWVVCVALLIVHNLTF